MPTEDRPAYSIAEWCVEARVSPALYFKEHKNGRGPAISHMGRRTVITESPRAYYTRLKVEAASSSRTAEAD